MKRHYWLLFSLLFFLLPFTLAPDVIPQIFSRQDPIDVDNIENYQSSEKAGVFNNQTVNIPDLPNNNISAVLGDTTAEKRVEVDLTTQHLYAFEGDRLVFNFMISSGTFNRTHPGTYYVWTKVPKQKMSGGSKQLGTYYYLPNVPHIMFIYNETHPKAMGYSLHGAYWHNNFGVPMSHGCVNMKLDDVAKLYAWMPDPKKESVTKVIIYGQYKPPTSSKVVLPKHI